MMDVPTWEEALDVEHWTPTATTETVMRIFEHYQNLPGVPTSYG